MPDLAVPPDKVAEPIFVEGVVELSQNVTVPVADDGVTVAVKVTWPPPLTDDVTTVVVAAWFTYCERTGDVDPAKFVSPL